MPRKSLPEDRAQAGEQSVKRIRRRYKKTLNKPKKVMPGEREFHKEMTIVLKLAGYTNSQIGSAIGISRGQVKELLEEPDVSERLLKLQENLPAAALDLLHGFSIEAAVAIMDVLRHSQDDKIILQAAAEILDRVGIAKVSKTQAEQHRVNENKLTVGADDAMMEALRELPAEKQEEAAVMVEELEKFLKNAKGDDE